MKRGGGDGQSPQNKSWLWKSRIFNSLLNDQNVWGTHSSHDCILDKCSKKYVIYIYICYTYLFKFSQNVTCPKFVFGILLTQWDWHINTKEKNSCPAVLRKASCCCTVKCKVVGCSLSGEWYSPPTIFCAQMRQWLAVSALLSLVAGNVVGAGRHPKQTFSSGERRLLRNLVTLLKNDPDLAHGKARLCFSGTVNQRPPSHA